MTKIIGLTGPIGSGKNQVCKILKRRGAYIIDVDRLGHELLVPQKKIWSELIKAFGSSILRPGGEINRKKLGDLVFADRKKLKKLNAIVHPSLFESVSQAVSEAKKQGYRLIVVNAALLEEIGLVSLVDEIWFVAAAVSLRLKRLLRSGMNPKKARQIIKLQGAMGTMRAKADRVLANNSSFKGLSVKVNGLLEQK